MKVWLAIAPVVGGIGLLWLVTHLVFGYGAGVSVLLVSLLAVLAWHGRQMARLARWARRRDGASPPRAGGPWGVVLHELDRKTRHEDAQIERLTQALERFRAAGHAMPDGVMYLSANDTIEWLNKKAEQHFGLDYQQDRGVALAGLVRNAELARYLGAGEWDEPLLLPSPRRPALKLQIEIVPFGDGQKMLISRDISQVEKLETMRRDFIANVSHELRTPLTVVSGFVETVVDGLDDLDRADVTRFLNLVLEQSSRMQHLIEDLLALSELETGAPAPTEQRVDVGKLVRRVSDEATVLSGGRHRIAVLLDENDGEDVLLGSEKELHSAFANLATNAVRYTPDGGTIRIRWQRTAQGAEFCVEDDGIGVDPAHLGRLTERFFRVDRGRSRETGGTGLGLAIVKHVASRHQGQLSIDSTLGVGSRFCIAFPVERVRPQPWQPVSPARQVSP